MDKHCKDRFTLIAAPPQGPRAAIALVGNPSNCDDSITALLPSSEYSIFNVIDLWAKLLNSVYSAASGFKFSLSSGTNRQYDWNGWEINIRWLQLQVMLHLVFREICRIVQNIQFPSECYIMYIVMWMKTWWIWDSYILKGLCAVNWNDPPHLVNSGGKFLPSSDLSKQMCFLNHMKNYLIKNLNW